MLHRAHRHRRALGKDAGPDDEPDLVVFQDRSLVADAGGVRISLGELRREVVLDCVEAFQPAAGLHHYVNLLVNVAVIDADYSERETQRGGHCNPSRTDETEG